MKAKLKRNETKAKRLGYPPFDGSRTIAGVRYEVDKVCDVPADIIKRYPTLFTLIKEKDNG